MRQRLCAMLSALLLLAALPGGASAYAKGEAGPGPASCADLGGYHFAFRYSEAAEERVMYVQRMDGNVLYGAVLRELSDAIRNKGINPAYLSAQYDHEGKILLKVQDIYNGEFQYTAAYSTAELDQRLEENVDCLNSFEEVTVSPDRKISIGLVPVGWQDREAVAAVHTDVGQWDSYAVLISGQSWGSHIKLLPYNSKTFMLVDTDTHQIYASENGTDWICLKDTDARPGPGIEQSPSVGSNYSFLWVEGEYISCRRVAEYMYNIGREGASGGTWYDPACTKVCFYDEDFSLTSSYDFGRQVCSVGYHDGVYYAEVADCEGVNEREYEHYGTSTLYASTDKENWEPTNIMDIVRSLRENK